VRRPRTTVVYSVAESCFAPMGRNAMTFPLASGRRRAVPDRPTRRRWRDYCGATGNGFLGVHDPIPMAAVPGGDRAVAPTGGMWCCADLRLGRRGVPAEVGRHWGRPLRLADILTASARTESLTHLPQQTHVWRRKYGTRRKPVRVTTSASVDDDGDEGWWPPTSWAELQVRGPTSAIHVWEQPRAVEGANFGGGSGRRSATSICGRARNYYVYCGRRGRSCSRSGRHLCVRPLSQVEGASETARCWKPPWWPGDQDKRVQAEGFVVLKTPRKALRHAGPELQKSTARRARALQISALDQFRPDLPKTAHRQIQRFRLRDPNSRRSD